MGIIITNSQCDKLPDGLIHVSQLIEHCTGLESCSGLKFFQALISQLPKLCAYCNDRVCLHKMMFSNTLKIVFDKHIFAGLFIMISVFVAVFTSWILSRILCVLAEADCSLLHDKSISAILSLLQVRGCGLRHEFLTTFL